MAGGVVQTFSGSTVSGQQTARDRANQRRGQRVGLVVVVMALLAGLTICSCGWLLFNSGLFAPGFTFGPGQRDATETPSVASTATGAGHSATPTQLASSGTPTPTATAIAVLTPTPDPRFTTVAFLVASQQISSPGGITACPSGCNIPGQSYTNYQTFSVSNVQSTFFPQTKVTGTIKATNVSATKNWQANNFVFSGNGYSCDPQDVFVPAGSSANFPCTVHITSPSSVPAGTIAGSVSGTSVTYTNPQALNGDAHWQVTAGDCGNAIADTQNQGTPWGTSWVNSQLSSGWQLAHSPPDFFWSDGQCPQNQQIQYFDASSVTHVSDAAFNPADARSLASTRLNGQVPSGYTLKPGSATTCNPSVMNLSGATISLTCSDSGLAILTWTESMKAQLAASVAGKSQSQALDICNHTSGVKPGSCVITINGGSATLPSSTSLIMVQANSP
jgi:hypothetical protein